VRRTNSLMGTNICFSAHTLGSAVFVITTFIFLFFSGKSETTRNLRNNWSTSGQFTGDLFGRQIPFAIDRLFLKTRGHLVQILGKRSSNSHPS
jgi:uncharacterized membrane protein YjfL (UPF0719 family)